MWNYLKRYQSYRADTISILKITKGNNSAKYVGGVTVFDLCTSSGHALYFYEVLWNYLERYQSYRADTISIPKISKGNNSAKNVGGVTVVNLCTSSDHALHLCQVSWNYLERYQSYRADTNDQPLTDGRTDGRTDGQKFGGYNIKNKKKIYFFSVNTKNISSHVLKITENSLELRTREFTDIFITFDEIYLVFTSKSKYPLFI